VIATVNHPVPDVTQEDQSDSSKEKIPHAVLIVRNSPSMHDE